VSEIYAHQGEEAEEAARVLMPMKTQVGLTMHTASDTNTFLDDDLEYLDDRE
jgi:hypothetical protein